VDTVPSCAYLHRLTTYKRPVIFPPGVGDLSLLNLPQINDYLVRRNNSNSVLSGFVSSGVLVTLRLLTRFSALNLVACY